MDYKAHLSILMLGDGIGWFKSRSSWNSSILLNNPPSFFLRNIPFLFPRSAFNLSLLFRTFLISSLCSSFWVEWFNHPLLFPIDEYSSIFIKAGKTWLFLDEHSHKEVSFSLISVYFFLILVSLVIAYFYSHEFVIGNIMW